MASHVIKIYNHTAHLANILRCSHPAPKDIDIVRCGSWERCSSACFMTLLLLDIFRIVLTTKNWDFDSWLRTPECWTNAVESWLCITILTGLYGSFISFAGLYKCRWNFVVLFWRWWRLFLPFDSLPFYPPSPHVDYWITSAHLLMLLCPAYNFMFRARQA